MNRPSFFLSTMSRSALTSVRPVFWARAGARAAITRMDAAISIPIRAANRPMHFSFGRGDKPSSPCP